MSGFDFQESAVNPNVSAIERAFQLARSGTVRTMVGIKAALRKGGFVNGQLDSMLALSKQLRSIMADPKGRPAGQSQPAAEWWHCFSAEKAMDWSKPLKASFTLRNGQKLRTLSQVRVFILELAEQRQHDPHWQLTSNMLSAAANGSTDMDELTDQLRRALAAEGVL
jgi:hypothetical protein